MRHTASVVTPQNGASGVGTSTHRARQREGTRPQAQMAATQ